MYLTLRSRGGRNKRSKNERGWGIEGLGVVEPRDARILSSGLGQKLTCGAQEFRSSCSSSAERKTLWSLGHGMSGEAKLLPADRNSSETKQGNATLPKMQTRHMSAHARRTVLLLAGADTPLHVKFNISTS